LSIKNKIKKNREFEKDLSEPDKLKLPTIAKAVHSPVNWIKEADLMTPINQSNLSDTRRLLESNNLNFVRMEAIRR
jgi:hypothetical protein